MDVTCDSGAPESLDAHSCQMLVDWVLLLVDVNYPALPADLEVNQMGSGCQRKSSGRTVPCCWME